MIHRPIALALAAWAFGVAHAQVALEGEHATYDVPMTDWSVEEDLQNGALFALLYGPTIDDGDMYEATEFEVQTITEAASEDAVRIAEYYDGQPIEALPDGGAIATASYAGNEHTYWIALPRGDGVLLARGTFGSMTADEARALALRMARGVRPKASVTGGASLAEAAPEPPRSREERLAALPEVDEATRAEVTSAHARETPQAAAQPRTGTVSPAPSPAAAYPIAVFGGSYNIYPKDGFLTLYVMSDGTAQRVTRPVKGPKDFPQVVMSGNRLTLSGPETITYALSQDADGTGRGKRLDVRGYENLWGIPPVTSDQAARWVGEFAQRRHTASGSDYARPGVPQTALTTTGTSEFAFDRGRYRASEGFVTVGTFNPSRAYAEGFEAETGAEATGSSATARASGVATGSYLVDGYRLVLTPDDGSGTYERTITVQRNDDGTQTLYIDGQVWLGDFDVF